MPEVGKSETRYGPREQQGRRKWKEKPDLAVHGGRGKVGRKGEGERENYARMCAPPGDVGSVADHRWVGRWFVEFRPVEESSIGTLEFLAASRNPLSATRSNFIYGSLPAHRPAGVIPLENSRKAHSATGELARTTFWVIVLEMTIPLTTSPSGARKKPARVTFFYVFLLLTPKENSFDRLEHKIYRASSPMELATPARVNRGGKIVNPRTRYFQRNCRSCEAEEPSRI